MALRIAALLTKRPPGKACAAANGCSIRKVRNAAWRPFGQQPFGAGLFWRIAASFRIAKGTTLGCPHFLRCAKTAFRRNDPQCHSRLLG